MASLSVPAEAAAAAPGLAGAGEVSGTRETSTFVADEEHVNDYVVVKELGRGTFASVFKVRDRRDGQLYAMKLIDKKYLRRRAGYMRLPTAGGTISRGPMPRPGLPGTGGGPGRPGPQNMEDPMDAVRREIAIMKKLNHRNIVRLVEVLDSEESPNLFMIMELAERGPVMKLLPTEAVPPLPEPEALRMFRQLLLGLEYLHAQGIAHRDLKPENLLIREDGRLIITDFGVSEVYTDNSDTAAKKKVGSPAFMAPEVFAAQRGNACGPAGPDSKGYSAYKADVWSLGVCLYCFLCGRLPFISVPDGPTMEDLVQTQEPAPSELLQPVHQHLLGQLLVKQPHERATLADIKTHAWVTENGRTPIDQQAIERQEVTDDEIRNSIVKLHHFGTLMRVYQAVRKFRSRGQSSGGQTPPSLTSSAESLHTADSTAPAATETTLSAPAATETTAAPSHPALSDGVDMSPLRVAPVDDVGLNAL